ncbi:hypothetical protein [Bacillus sp. 1P06AnD]|uniref:hypothetical protein n=1 Tax=Bacillus sp. 1P06AnD TaxID=3132208 RepID=UPI00399FB0B2
MNIMKMIGYIGVVVGILMILTGFSYLFGYTTNHFFKYALYIGLLVTVLFSTFIGGKSKNEM